MGICACVVPVQHCTSEAGVALTAAASGLISFVHDLSNQLSHGPLLNSFADGALERLRLQTNTDTSANTGRVSKQQIGRSAGAGPS